MLLGKQPQKRFIPPTVDEVAAYCFERNNGIDAQHFVDYYAQQKWKLSNGNPMADWKAAVRNWEKNDGVFARNAKERGNGVSADSNSSFDTDEFFRAALKRSYGTDVPV